MAGRTLLVASGGGHLKQLKNLAVRIPWASESRVWITVDTPHSRTLLDDEAEVIFVPSARSRDVIAALSNAKSVRTHIRRNGFSHAVSTGASLAVSVLPWARAAGASCHFIESAARVDGPSVSGRMLAHVPGLHRYAQYRHWRSRGWAYAGSVFDSFKPDITVEAARLQRVVVTLGTLENFPFRKVLERMIQILPPEIEVLWQTGCTTVQDLGINARPMVPEPEFTTALTSADVVVAHAGVGSALSALESGKIPILVPRRARRHEHVDDHQEQLARELEERGLARWIEADKLTLDDLLKASRARLNLVQTAPPTLDLQA